MSEVVVSASIVIGEPWEQEFDYQVGNSLLDISDPNKIKDFIREHVLGQNKSIIIE
jgi:hypothetical protein